MKNAPVHGERKFGGKVRPRLKQIPGGKWRCEECKRYTHSARNHSLGLCGDCCRIPEVLARHNALRLKGAQV
jgi:hypothetical protein